MSDQPIYEMSAGTIRTGTIRIGPPAPTLTPEECIAHGGHCHAPTGSARSSLPPQYEERCRHCGHVRWAIPQDAFRYVDEETR